MKFSDNEQKQRSIEVAEEARQTEWHYGSFAADLFKGRFRWSAISPFPMQEPADAAVGDVFLARLEACLKEHIDPDAVDRTGIVPPAAIEALARIGCFGMKITREYGGLGLSQTNYNRAISLVASHCSSTAVWLSAHQSIGVPQPLKLFGSDAQKRAFLPRLAKGEISAFALTEPDVGSDPARMKTTATPTEDGRFYLLNGIKSWCTNGPSADILVVMARTPSIIRHGKERPQITAFIVEGNSPGLETIHICEFMGLKGISNGLLKFTDVRVPAENIIGAPGMGLKIALTTLNTGRLTLPAASAAINKVCLKTARTWAKQRVQWGTPIGEHQAIADKLARMAADTFASETLADLGSALADRGDTDIRLEAAIAKFFCTESAWHVADEAMQICGGRGYETYSSLRARGETPIPIERLLRDCRINRIIEGTSEIMRLFLAREAMDVHFRQLMPLMDRRVPAGEKLKQALRAVGFYLAWYPPLYLPFRAPLRTRQLSRRNRGHLRHIARTSRRLARKLFHAMLFHQQRLEKEQLILFRLVDIGIDLFSMAATLSRAERMMMEAPDDRTPDELADMFCRTARERIDANFRQLRQSRRLLGRMTPRVLDGAYAWLETGLVPPATAPATATDPAHPAYDPNAVRTAKPAAARPRKRRRESRQTT